ncbi:MAG: hypothetical protein KDB27_29485 [Planctomycetales bacterium]|nr:hypothetical protein [Planctomycetales bacterium]
MNMPLSTIQFVTFTTAIAVCAIGSSAPLPVAELSRETDVDFAKEVLPILRKNCLACHNETDAEGDIVLESAATIIKGGSSGAGVVPGNSEESYLFTLATHADDPVMPPEDNEVGASNLAPQELAIIKLWIDQGAKAGTTAVDAKINWQPLPAVVNPVLAVSTSNDGRFVAVGRANHIFLHHGPSGLSLGQLVDSSLVSEHGETAHLDMVQSLAISPDNQWIVSGGYRTAKVWKSDAPQFQPVANLEGVQRIAATDGATTVTLHSDKVTILVAGTRREIKIASPLAAALNADATKLVAANAEGVLICDVGNPDAVASSAFSSPSKVVAVSGDTVAVSLAEKPNDIQLYRAVSTDGSAQLESIGRLSGHGGEVLTIGFVGENLVTGAADNTVRIWNVAEKNQIRQLDAGAPARHVAGSEVSNRIVAATGSGEVRTWNITDGTLLGTAKTDHRLLSKKANAQFARDVQNRQVNNANADNEAAKKRLTEEENNLKKSQENRGKAEEEKKKKDDAAKVAKDEFDNAQKTLDEANAKVAKAKETQDSANKTLAESKGKYDQFLDELVRAQQAYVAAATKAAEATDAVAKAKSAFDTDKENADLKAKYDAANAASTQAHAEKNKADEARAASLANASEASSAKEASAKSISEAMATIAEVEKTLEPFKKAVDEKKKNLETKQREQTDAAKTLETAVASIAQAERAIERSKSTLNDTETALNAAKKEAEMLEAKFKAAETAANEFKFAFDSLSISQDGLHAAALCRDSIYVFATSNAAPIQVITQGNSVALAYESDATLAVVNTDGTVHTVNALPSWSHAYSIGNPSGDSPLADRVTAIAISPDSQSVALGGGEPSRRGELRIYCLTDGSLVRDFENAHSDTVYSIQFSPDGSKLASAAADRFMKVFDVQTGELVRNFEGHTHHVLSVSWQADARVLATAGADKVVKLWNMNDGSQLRTIQGFGKEVTALKHYGPNDQFVAVSGDQSIYRCNQGGARDGIGRAGDFLYTVSSSMDGATIAYGGHDSVVRVIDSNGKSVTDLLPSK